MRKNLLYLTKKCLKYSIAIVLIVLLVRYSLRIDVTITKTYEQKEQHYQSYINKFRHSSRYKDGQAPSASLDFDISFGLFDSLEDISVLSSENALNNQKDPQSVYVRNFSSFLKSKYFYFDRDFNETYSNVMCSYVPNNLEGKFDIDTREIEYEDVVKKYENEFSEDSGGHWKPKTCQAHSRVAIIIPYRDRQKHLNVFLNNMHKFLQKQLIDYAIYIIEEVPNVKFNRALLMNIGYNESIKDYDWSCFIFHDVDLVPEDDRNMYYCPYYPRHMSARVNTLGYTIPYKEIMGGVTAISRKHFELINGFPNIYFGWGGEDDDLSARVQSNNLKIIRYPDYISRYFMLFHEKDDPSEHRFHLLESAKSRFKTDGLNSLKYQVLKREFRQLYTWVLVSFDEPH